MKNDNLRLSHGDIGKVNFTKLLTKYGNNYQISANLINVKPPYQASVKININKDIPDDKLPDIQVSFSGKEVDNTHGWDNTHRFKYTLLQNTHILRYTIATYTFSNTHYFNIHYFNTYLFQYNKHLGIQHSNIHIFKH